MRALKRPISKLVATVMVLLPLMIGADLWDSGANRLQAAQGLQSVPVDPNSYGSTIWVSLVCR
jgi:hypothetical protein